MKKNLVIIGMTLLGAVVLPSCKKNYTCTCNVEEKKYIYDYSGRLKSEAEKACNEQDAAAKRTDPKGTCKLTKD